MKLTPRTHEELAQLAQDIVANNVITSLQIPADMIRHVFMVLMLMSGDEIKEITESDIGLIYEYYSEGISGRAINGYPIFFSMRWLSRDDTKKVFELVDKIRAAIQDAIQ